MQELLAYLRANGFKTFIVSGGCVEFMRALGGEGLRHSARAGDRQPAGSEVRDEGRQAGADARAEDRLRRRRAGQARGHLSRTSASGRSLAFGNSDGDLQMLQCDGGRRGHAPGAHRPPRRRRRASTPTTGSRTSASSTRPGTRRAPRAGPSSSMKSDWKKVFAFERVEEHDRCE